MGRNKQTQVVSILHKDKRVNIPTEELRDFMAEEEGAPKTMLYPRDPSLDPQLVWKGKDDLDREDFEVPVVPIYIQEKIHPQAIIDDLIRTKKPGGALSRLFSDFNGGPQEFSQKIDFYHHEQNWTNRMILGDSLLVMTSLAEKEGLKGKVQTIYIDPPYGIKFGSNWQVSTRKRDVKDGRVEDVTRQPEQVRAFRDTWRLGIHSYLSYLRDRLVIALDLLTETGSLFVQIGDENAHLVRCLIDEVFGSENFIANIAFKKKKMPLGETYIFTMCDYILWYGKDSKKTKFRKLFTSRSDSNDGDYGYVEMSSGEILSRAKLPSEIAGTSSGRIFQSMDLRSSGRTESCVFQFEFAGQKFFPSGGKSWKTNLDGMKKLLVANRLFFSGDSLRYKLYFDDYPVQEISHMWMDTQGAIDKEYVVQTSTKVIERCLLMTTDPGDLVVDPTCGSGTTAYVAEQWGRRWITCDTSRVALALSRTRLMTAKYPYYLLADSPEGVRKENELTNKMVSEVETKDDIKKGFIYKSVPHVTLGSITNNPDIKEGMTRQEIKSAIARHAETEILYDQPYEDSKRVRVCGPFSVESLSPNRVLSTIVENTENTLAELEACKKQNFDYMILENLKKAGVQNTRKEERIKFDRLNPYAGIWINGSGEFTDNEGKVRRVAVSIGPEHGTVGPQQVKEAAKEAVQGIGFDILIVCGFAFDPHVGEEAKRYGNLTVLATRMNADLAMGDELLKKTGSGNLFMVFGEPDVEIRKQKDKIVIEIKGLDVYDPTTGQIRNSSTDDIACWFIDTDYNGDSFFVRHSYFTGADEPYENLKRALRGEIDETAWGSLYSTISRPFDKPESGKIAVKVINHYGDEVLKVFDIH